jgi:AcrR family transcriptional regulator
MKSRDERPRSPRRDDAKAGPRRRVLAAAMEVFAREGYHAARMDAIAEAAGVPKGALYFHFPGKLPLFSALVDEFAAELRADVAAAIAAYQGGVARVEAAVTTALSLFGRRRVLGRCAALVRHHLDRGSRRGKHPAARQPRGRLRVARGAQRGRDAVAGRRAVRARGRCAHALRLTAPLRRRGGDGRDVGSLRGGFPLRAVIHLSTVIHRRRSGASGAALRHGQPAEPRQIGAREGEESDRPMNARARRSRRRASA